MSEDATNEPADKKGLEGVVKKSLPYYTNIERCGQVAKGVAVPLIGAAIGFYATRGIGGAGLGACLTSLGMSAAEQHDLPGYEYDGYRLGFVVSAVAVVMGSIKYLFIDH